MKKFGRFQEVLSSVAVGSANVMIATINLGGDAENTVIAKHKCRSCKTEVVTASTKSPFCPICSSDLKVVSSTTEITPEEIAALPIICSCAECEHEIHASQEIVDTAKAGTKFACTVCSETLSIKASDDEEDSEDEDAEDETEEFEDDAEDEDKDEDSEEDETVTASDDEDEDDLITDADEETDEDIVDDESEEEETTASAEVVDEAPSEEDKTITEEKIVTATITDKVVANEGETSAVADLIVDGAVTAVSGTGAIATADIVGAEATDKLVVADNVITLPLKEAGEPIEVDAARMASKDSVGIDIVASMPDSKGNVKWYMVANYSDHDTIVAAASIDRASDSVKPLFNTPKFVEAFVLASQAQGADESVYMKDFGFKSVVTKVDLDRAVRDEIDQKVESRLEVAASSVEDAIEKVSSCLSTASLGVRKGTYGVVSPLLVAMADAFKNAGVANANELAASVLETAGSEEMKLVLSRTKELAAQSPELVKKEAEMVEASLSASYSNVTAANPVVRLATMRGSVPQAKLTESVNVEKASDDSDDKFDKLLANIRRGKSR